VLTAAERVVSALAVSTLLAGIVGAGTVTPAAEERAAPVVAADIETPAAATPTAAPRPAARPTPRPVPRRTAAPVDRPVAAAPPLTGCPARPRNGGGTPRPLPPPVVAETELPKPVPVDAKATSLDAVRGKGLWATPLGKRPLDVAGLVAQARRTHVRSIWVRTGGTRQGYYGDRFLPQLVAAAHAHGVRVIAWDFPFLSDPVADATRARQALAARVDGFSPDVETAAEGTRLTPRRVALYLSLVRTYAGKRPVVATVPRPSAARRTYPYAAFRPYADAFAPMVYWSCLEPGALVQQSLARLSRLLPVAPVGQAYDMGSEGGRRGTPSRQETLRFLDAARRAGAIGASLWTVEEAGPAQLRALADYRWSVSR
jgi:hypothetical protein